MEESNKEQVRMGIFYVLLCALLCAASAVSIQVSTIKMWYGFVSLFLSPIIIFGIMRFYIFMTEEY